MPEQLWNTTLDPSKRTLRRLTVQVCAGPLSTVRYADAVRPSHEDTQLRRRATLFGRLCTSRAAWLHQRMFVCTRLTCAALCQCICGGCIEPSHPSRPKTFVKLVRMTSHICIVMHRRTRRRRAMCSRC